MRDGAREGGGVGGGSLGAGRVYGRKGKNEWNEVYCEWILRRGGRGTARKG